MIELGPGPQLKRSCHWDIVDIWLNFMNSLTCRKNSAKIEDDSHSPSFQWGLFELENSVPWNIWAKSGKSSANLWEANQGLFLGILGFYPLPMVDFPLDFRYECLFAEGQCLSNVFTCQILTGWWFIWGLYGMAERISTPWKFRLSNCQFATQLVRLFWSPNSCLAGCLPGIAGEPVYHCINIHDKKTCILYNRIIKIG